ncbi:MAG: NAD(P)H-binding protein [Pseudomonadota bacterium]
MRILVVGAAGRVGQHLVSQALTARHQVVACVRDASRIERQHTWLRVVACDASEVELLAEAAQDCDAVISAIGGKRVAGPRSFIADGMRGIIAALQQAGPRRLVAIGSKGLTPGPQPDLLLGDVDMPAALRFAFADHRAAFGLLRQSRLDWTVLCPPHMPEGPRTGRYQTELDGFPSNYGAISTGDVAQAALDALGQDTWIGHTVGVAGLKPAA